MKECPNCSGTGRIWYSCCGDEIISNEELEMCPTCHEWCSSDDDEECDWCDGTGGVSDEPDPNDLYDQERLTEHFES